MPAELIDCKKCGKLYDFRDYDCPYCNEAKDGIVSPCKALELLKSDEVELEFLHEVWFPLFDESPICILWKYPIRIKKTIKEVDI